MRTPTDHVTLDHGSGGKIAHQFAVEMLLPLVRHPALAQLNDGAILEIGGLRLAFSTDSYTVDPLFFPGGDIGELAVNGTVNDLAMCGAEPLYLSLALIIEEGFPMADLQRVLQSTRQAAERAGVAVVTGDTKVVPRGAADRLFINTAGIGVIAPQTRVASDRARPGDRILLSGSLADHGITVLSQREGMHFESQAASDTAALHRMVAGMLAAAPDLHVLRDPTRGGLGTALNEIAAASRVGVLIRQACLPVKPAVRGLCDLLGFDPLYLANEGKLVAFVAAAQAAAVLEAMRRDPAGAEACIIGEVTDGPPGRVVMETLIGGRRIVDMLAGEQLPRIC
jgi:hydrogenase expression/formation protein HypE